MAGCYWEITFIYGRTYIRISQGWNFIIIDSKIQLIPYPDFL